MTTLYDTLGVSEHANADELKRAYRKAMMKWHPDRNAGNEAAAHAAFQDVKAAYAILSDPAQRREYDTIFAAEMRRWAKQHAASPDSDTAKSTRARTAAPEPEKEAAQAQDKRAHAEQRRAEQDHAAQRQAEREQAGHEARARAEAEARYADHVAHAMRYAADGYNRDVVFGVLLGRHCDLLDARRIADSVTAWHAAPAASDARSPAASDKPSPHSPATSPTEAGPTADHEDGDASESIAAAHGDTRDETAKTARRPSAKRKKSAAVPADHAESGTPDKALDGIDTPSPAHAFSTLWYHFLNGLKL